MVRLSQREYQQLLVSRDQAREQLAQANQRIAELSGEIAGLAMLVAQGNERITELLAIVSSDT